MLCLDKIFILVIIITEDNMPKKTTIYSDCRIVVSNSKSINMVVKERIFVEQQTTPQ